MIRDQLQFGAVSVLFNEPKLLKCKTKCRTSNQARVSVLFNEPKLLKCDVDARTVLVCDEVSVLFNEPKLLKFGVGERRRQRKSRVSVLFNEPKLLKCDTGALPRCRIVVSVLFNEPKLLKSFRSRRTPPKSTSFSALQRAEIAEIVFIGSSSKPRAAFQCSSTSRNC